MEDERIELIEAELGIEGFAVIVKLLSKIYGQNGYYYQWDTDCAMLFARKNGISCDFVNKVVDVAIRRGLFNRRMFEQYGILTSSEIQTFFINAAKRRKDVSIDRRFVCANNDEAFAAGENVKSTIFEKDVTAEKAVTEVTEDVILREEAFSGMLYPEEPYIDTDITGDGEHYVVYPSYPEVTLCDDTKRVEKDVACSEEAVAPEKKRAFGRHANVMLTESERIELGKTINDADEYIDRFSQKLHDKGYRYADHYSAILDWWKRDSALVESGVVIIGKGGNGSNGGNGSKDSTFDTDEFFAAASKKSKSRKVDTV